MRELIPAVKGIWAGDYAHDGEFFKFPATTSSPKPLQKPHRPYGLLLATPTRTSLPLRTAAMCR